MMIVKLGVTLMVSWISYKDHYERKIPNIALLILIALRLLEGHIYPVAFENIQWSFLVFIAFWYPYKMKWFGAGDVKYLMILLLFVPKVYLMESLISVFLIGGILSAVGKFVFKEKKVPYSYGISITLLYFVLIGGL